MPLDPKVRAENLAQAIEDFISRVQERGDALLRSAQEGVLTIKALSPSEADIKTNLRLYIKILRQGLAATTEEVKKKDGPVEH